jgi:hypothetical protein
VRFEFRSFPAASGGLLTPRPIVDIALEGLEAAPLACLLDTGALRTRIDREFAELAGIDLADTVTERLVLGGIPTVGAFAHVTLTLADGQEEHSWDAPVWFCEPWPFAFGLAGLEGFLQHFRVTVSGYHEYLEVEPETV